MKKLLALTLAVAMVLSLASVAFAATGEEYAVADKAHYIKDGNIRANIHAFRYGDKVYYPLGMGENVVNVDSVLMNHDAADDIKVSAKWQMNEDLVESVDVVPVLVTKFHNKNVDGVTNDSLEGAKKAIYVVAVETKKMPENVDNEDVIGTITLKAPKSADMFYIMGEGGDREIDLEVAFELSNKDADLDNEGYNKTYDGNYVYDFDGIEDEEFEIELFAGMGRFEVNTIGQGKLVINTDVEFDEGIENAQADVNYVYFNSNYPTFNRLGNLYINANEGDILYRVNKDGSLSKMPTEYDEDEEAFVLRTRVIGSYVVAEEELDVETLKVNVEAPKAPEAVTPANPSTGAAL